MWTVSIFKALLLQVRTLPFLVIRVLVHGGIALVLAGAAVAGATAGVQVAPLGDAAPAGADATVGALAGIVLAAGLLSLARDRLLHLVQAGTIALQVDGLDHQRFPNGRGQVDHARAAVIGRFGSRGELMALDRLVRGVTGRIPAIAEDVPSSLTWPGLGRLASGGLVDQVILAHAYRARPENAWEAAHDGLVLYIQNARAVLAAAGWINLIAWVATGAAFLVIVGWLGGVLPLWPGAGQAGGIVLAALAAWALRAAVIEPFAFACLFQRFLLVTKGQDPAPEWRGRLTQLCDRFRQLGERAVTWAPEAGAGA